MDKLSIGCTSTNVFVLLSLATNSCLVNVLAMHLEAPHCNSVAYRSKYTNFSPQRCCLFIHAIIRLLFIEGGNVPLASCTNRFSIIYLAWDAYIHGANKYSSGVRCVRTNYLQRFCFSYFLFHVCSFSTAGTDLAGDRCQPPPTNI